jgi:hypothetical protein
MKIGIDLDNTIICYDELFVLVAREEGYDCNQATTKKDIKSWFHSNDMYDVFTRIQGLVYGKYIDRANLFKGVKACFTNWRSDQHKLYIVSHKTKYPVLGEKINLRETAAKYLHNSSILNQDIVPISNLFFEDTAALKLARISKLQLDLFIDDLPSILENVAFPTFTDKILFDPLHQNHGYSYDLIASNWLEIAQFTEKKPRLSV